MANLDFSQLELPAEQAKGVYVQAQTSSTLATLTSAKPQGIGSQQYVTLSARPKAQVLGAGQAKVNSGSALANVKVPTLKAQVTLRFDEEVKWADEDYQIGVLTTLGDAGAQALARQVDLTAFHALSAHNGSQIGNQPMWASQTTKSVELGSSPNDALVSAIGLLVTSGSPDCVALTPEFAWALANERTANGVLLNPGVGIGTALSSVKGLRSSASTTVSAAEETADTKVRGFVFDSSVFAWGINRRMPVTMIEYGNPDGLGDLKELNQVALRLEMTYSVGIVDLTRVAKVVDAA